MRAGILLALAVAIFGPCSCCTTDDDILIDIVFVVDGSGSIGVSNFELVKKWLINATSIMFNKFGERAQFEVLEYSDNDPVYLNVPIDKSTVFEIPFRLGECRSVTCMASRIQSMRYLQSQTYTAYAIRRVIEVEFPLSEHYPKAKKAIILLTDGTANDGLFLRDLYKRCDELNITNFAIGVGNYQMNQLRAFANGGSSDEHVFTTTSFKSLSSVIGLLDSELDVAGFFCDECNSGTHDCHTNAECINTADGYNCKCAEGYYGDGRECKQIDYCASKPCSDENSECVSGQKGHRCVCAEGFRDNKGICENIDNCASNPCPGDNAVCEDRVGGYMCACAEGHEWDGSTCIEGGDNQSMLITIVTLVLAALVLATIVGVVAYFTCPRSHKFTIAGSDEDEQFDMDRGGPSSERI